MSAGSSMDLLGYGAFWTLPEPFLPELDVHGDCLVVFFYVLHGAGLLFLCHVFYFYGHLVSAVALLFSFFFR
jgi:hypothetical protein